MVTSTDFVFTLLGVGLGICAMSFNWFGDTIAFRMAEGCWVGGLTALSVFRTADLIRTGALIPISQGNLLKLVPFVVGILVFTRFTRYRWFARYALTITAGIGLGLSVPASIDANILTGITATAKNVISLSDPVNNIFILVGLITSLTYFVYSMKIGSVFHSNKSKLRWLMRVGQIVLMISFGYMYSQLLITEGTDFLISSVIVIFKRTYTIILQFLGG
jgi:hypothetical protein